MIGAVAQNSLDRLPVAAVAEFFDGVPEEFCLLYA